MIGLGLAATPFYFAALLVGSKLSGMASEQTFRRVTFVLIVLSAFLALPATQQLGRWLMG